ncbi:adhesive plaque matrix protein-like [Uloborus diversus]|uniref:adhesive plaque matrix protein-like n=1 Tax=Uloborus diversus TaxID=327109 RepID=UPI00240A2F52|nr:adhesive plaque matrix protein-like [Uloborus diversus]
MKYFVVLLVLSLATAAWCISSTYYDPNYGYGSGLNNYYKPSYSTYKPYYEPAVGYRPYQGYDTSYGYDYLPAYSTYQPYYAYRPFYRPYYGMLYNPYYFGSYKHGIRYYGSDKK